MKKLPGFLDSHMKKALSRKTRTRLKNKEVPDMPQNVIIYTTPT
jgi:hypothetical protein